MSNFSEYSEICDDIERLCMILDLFKKKKLTKEEACKIILNDKRFYKTKIEKESYPYIPYPSGYPISTTGATPYPLSGISTYPSTTASSVTFE